MSTRSQVQGSTFRINNREGIMNSILEVFSTAQRTKMGFAEEGEMR
jgi:hypothetical protein